MEQKIFGMTDAKQKALDSCIAKIRKDYGAGIIAKLSEPGLKVATFPSGILSVDIALGCGGIPLGRVIEVFGPESSGKTTFSLVVAASCQRDGGMVAFVDAEHALDPNYAKKIGVDIDNLLVSQPDTGEQALDIVESLVLSGAIDIIVVDSVAALVPKAEIEGDMGDCHVGLQARLMSQAMRKLTASVAKTKTTVIFINQLREKVGVMFGNPEVTTGGRALKFYSSVRLDVRRIESIKEDSVAIGNRVRIKVVKNKVAPPFKQAEFDLMFGSGYSREGCLIDLAVDREIISKSGAWYSYKDTRVGQGRENVKKFLVEHPDVAKEIETIIRENEFSNLRNATQQPEISTQTIEE